MKMDEQEKKGKKEEFVVAVDVDDKETTKRQREEQRVKEQRVKETTTTTFPLLVHLFDKKEEQGNSHQQEVMTPLQVDTTTRGQPPRQQPEIMATTNNNNSNNSSTTTSQQRESQHDDSDEHHPHPRQSLSSSSSPSSSSSSLNRRVGNDVDDKQQRKQEKEVHSKAVRSIIDYINSFPPSSSTNQRHQNIRSSVGRKRQLIESVKRQFSDLSFWRAIRTEFLSVLIFVTFSGLIVHSQSPTTTINQLSSSGRVGANVNSSSRQQQQPVWSSSPSSCLSIVSPSSQVLINTLESLTTGFSVASILVLLLFLTSSSSSSASSSSRRRTRFEGSCHLNPCLTFVLYVTRHLDTREKKGISSLKLISLVVVQLIGSLLAAFLLYGLSEGGGGHLDHPSSSSSSYPGSRSPPQFLDIKSSSPSSSPTIISFLTTHSTLMTFPPPSTSSSEQMNPSRLFGFEFLGSFLVILTYFSVTDGDGDRRKWSSSSSTSFLFVGLSVISAHLLTYTTSGAALNPVRIFGLAVVTSKWTFHWVYWAAHFTGSLFAAFTYEYVKSSKRRREDEENEEARSQKERKCRHHRHHHRKGKGQIGGERGAFLFADSVQTSSSSSCSSSEGENEEEKGDQKVQNSGPSSSSMTRKQEKPLLSGEIDADSRHRRHESNDQHYEEDEGMMKERTKKRRKGEDGEREHHQDDQAFPNVNDEIRKKKRSREDSRETKDLRVVGGNDERRKKESSSTTTKTKMNQMRDQTCKSTVEQPNFHPKGGGKTKGIFVVSPSSSSTHRGESVGAVSKVDKNDDNHYQQQEDNSWIPRPSTLMTPTTTMTTMTSSVKRENSLTSGLSSVLRGNEKVNQTEMTEMAFISSPPTGLSSYTSILVSDDGSNNDHSHSRSDRLLLLQRESPVDGHDDDRLGTQKGDEMKEGKQENQFHRNHHSTPNGVSSHPHNQELVDGGNVISLA